MDRHEKRSTRKWGLSNFWGDYCWWCTRTMATRYAHQSSGSFGRWLADADHLAEARASAFAYLSLREEGRTQVSLDQLLKRVDLCERSAAMWDSLVGGKHSQIVLLQDFVAKNPDHNPVETCEIVQLEVRGVRRLAVKHDAPIQTDCAPRPGLDNVRMSLAVASDDPADWKLLESLAAAALVRDVVAPARGASSSGHGKVTWAFGGTGKVHTYLLGSRPNGLGPTSGNQSAWL